MDWRWALAAAIDVTAASYLVGDLLVLRSYGSFLGLLADGLIAFAMAYLINFVMMTGRVSMLVMLGFALAVAMGEILIHKFYEKTGIIIREDTLNNK
ncbi:hypothetical protein N752_07090 [Desulforamulus aquiferis]|nr:DUF2512 family protein [Desulforamulus aquiferis]RYD05653.1 hypothetical protein N752_07090 [Desulforamulus aquiferis]